jgi:hypothetical protein
VLFSAGSDDHPPIQRLWVAVLSGNYPSVVEALLLGVDVNWVDPEEESRSIIHALACTGGDPALMEFLLQNGGEVNIEDGRYARPTIARAQVHCLMLLLLLLLPANRRKRTALHYSVEQDRPDLCKILRSKGATLTKDRDGTPHRSGFTLVRRGVVG